MLVLTRRRGEKVILSIDGKVLATIVVTNVCGGQATLAFGADKTVRIDRDEVADRRNERGGK